MKKILIIDDNYIQLRMIKGYLDNDYEVYVEKNAIDGINFAKQQIIDLIILDYDMPGVNGIEAYKLLQEDKRTKDIPVLFLTAIAAPDVILEASKLKPAGYILKPVMPDALIKRIETVFDLQQ